MLTGAGSQNTGNPALPPTTVPTIRRSRGSVNQNLGSNSGQNLLTGAGSENIENPGLPPRTVPFGRESRGSVDQNLASNSGQNNLSNNAQIAFEISIQSSSAVVQV